MGILHRQEGERIQKIILILIIIAGMAIGISFIYSEFERAQRLGLTEKQYDLTKYDGQNIIIIKPRFTEAAYSKYGFYDYYEGRCSKDCLSIPLQQGEITRWGAFNINSIHYIEYFGWPTITDVEVYEKLKLDPDYLLQYDGVILLHNEYVPRLFFDSIIKHPNVIYLMPNALYAEISWDNRTMALIRGHHYPSPDILNGFDWKHDNSKEEYDLDCLSWSFRKISNGYQLNCYPEKIILNNPDIFAEAVRLANQK